MSEQLKQEFEADIDRLEAGTTIDGEIIGNQEKGPAEGKTDYQKHSQRKRPVERGRSVADGFHAGQGRICGADRQKGNPSRRKQKNNSV